MKRFMWLMAVSGWVSVASAQTIQNGDFSDTSGWELSQGGTSGTARILGGFLELSVSFVGDFAKARQRCTSTASTRTVEVDVSDLGLGTTAFEIGWENEAGTQGQYHPVNRAGVASAATSNPQYTFVVFRADRDRLGPAAQKLDNARVLESVTPTQGDIDGMADHLTGEGPRPEEPDPNNDSEEDVADLVTLINQKNAAGP